MQVIITTAKRIKYHQGLCTLELRKCAFDPDPRVHTGCAWFPCHPNAPLRRWFPCAHSPPIRVNHVSSYHTIALGIMAAAAARISGVENTHLLSNVRTNGCIELEHRTDQDETTVNWTIWWFTCKYVACKAIIVSFLRRVVNHLLY